MLSVFAPRSNFTARASLVVIAATAAGACMFGYAYARSSYATGVGVEVAQPIPFSHQHHVSGLGIDCRYYHDMAKQAAFAGMPST